MRKRMLSVFLALCMMISVFTVPALAAGPENGTGTAAQSDDMADSQREGAGQTDGGSSVSTGDSSTAGASTPARDTTQAGAGTPAGDTTPGNSAPVVTLSGSVDYLDENGDSQTLTDNWTAVTADLLTWTNGWYVATGEVTIGSRVTVAGDVHLILADGASLTVKGGISVEKGNSFTIYAQSTGDAMGTLTAQNCGRNMAGIGSASGTAGTITINGGAISAQGGDGAAGIGSAYNGAGSSNINGGTITINGGSVTATGGFYSDFVSMGGAGIGGGYLADGGTITINGGTVNGRGAGNGAGIGGGYGRAGGSITITGGNITAGGNNGGAGIGGGSYADGGSITITGGVVWANGGNSGSGFNGNGAGIGGGYDGGAGTITINGGEVQATGGNNGGYNKANSQAIGTGGGGTGGTITITGGTVKATGGTGCIGGTDTTFSTGDQGTGLIIASSITDNDDTSTWGGIIFQGNEGLVGGTQTLGESMTLEAGKTLTVGENASLTVPADITLSVYGNLIRQGDITNDGTILVYPGGSYTGTQTTPNPVRYVQVPYLDADGSTQTAGTVTAIQDQTSWTDGWYLVTGDVTIDSRVTVTGDVKLILADGSNLTVNGGIDVNEGNDFTVYAQSQGDTAGVLLADATQERQCAGIGGQYGQSGGTITINGGQITALGGPNTSSTSSVGGAGIGGGCFAEGGTIVINGGTVSATGGGNAAGIGGGYNGGSGSIAINGGSVTARGGYLASGIGSGWFGNNGSVTISGGQVTAYGGDNSAGIGCGEYGQTVDVTITGGTVTAYGKHGGAGIGAGGNGSWGSASTAGTITISGGLVTALADDSVENRGAGIGAGYNSNGGTFTTGENGTGLIIASSITDNDDTSTWSGIIFQGDEGQVYGEQTLGENLTLEAGKTLTVGADASLTVPADVTLSVYGDLIRQGDITNEGVILVYPDGSYTGTQTTPNPVRYAQVPYLDEGGAAQTADAAPVIQEQTEWTDGWYVVTGAVTIDNLVTVTGDVKLILADGASLTVNGGISVTEGNAFTVYAQSTGDAMGALTVRNVEMNQAGIGGNVSDSGVITIVGGNLDITGGTYAAGIGGGTGGTGNVTIRGGIITVNGVEWGGAGIGDGCQTELSTIGGHVTITGGTVNATGGSSGAGIGGIFDCSVEISGGNITATGGAEGGAGIGGNYGQTGGDITITGGTITATGGAEGGAGIGAGFSCDSGNIRIYDGTITATGGSNAAGIGGSAGGNGNVTIASGTVNATGGLYGAGIGGGSNGTGDVAV